MRYFPLALVSASLIAATVSLAHAEVIGVIDAGNGAVIDLHNTAGPCVSGAMLAEYWPSRQTALVIPGCYRMIGNMIIVAFLDADTARIPVTAVKNPVRS